MREPINEKSADNRDTSIDNISTECQNADKRQQIGNDPNSYIYNGYKIHERFNPDGPPFADCIVRVFA